jgi:hypothetical protein
VLDDEDHWRQSGRQSHGASDYRDYLMRVPAADDPELDPGWTRELYDKGMLATRQPHPATLALFPGWDEVGQAAVAQNDAGQPTLAVRLGGLVLGLVIEGHGQEPGLTAAAARAREPDGPRAGSSVGEERELQPASQSRNRRTRPTIVTAAEL